MRLRLVGDDGAAGSGRTRPAGLQMSCLVLLMILGGSRPGPTAACGGPSVVSGDARWCMCCACEWLNNTQRSIVSTLIASHRTIISAFQRLQASQEDPEHS